MIDLAAQVEMFERQEAWLIAQVLKPRLGLKRQRELNLRIERHVREYDRFVETYGLELVVLVKQFAASRPKPRTVNRKSQTR